ncbi:GT2 family glycosyltransferase [Azospirillum agricola]|uniref:glycosyltransferase family 2 protein n=1 Tax=Azospirillum agricola TaxID=1720247 RepID=UPI001AE14ED0|nr:glycosyltransferase family 2 protein [Azospirillum agricola]MBP2232970.1 GT2 family glycosyltransferase [Azospirillum agricola]
MTGPSLRIVTVNWNAGPLLHDCVGSLPRALPQTPTGGFTLERMVVVDNASADGSADALEDAAPGLPVTVLRNAENRGFAAACNQGAAKSEADWLLFLNPDTRLSADSLAPAFAFLADPANGRVGALGVRLVDEAGHTQRCCARTPTPGRLVAQSLGLDRALPGLFPPHFMTGWDHADTRDVDQVMGAFLLVRRSLFEAVGGFDERFFVYYDDVELCLQVRRAGWRVVHFAGAEAYHRGGGTTDQVRATRLFYGLRSRLQFVAKHHGPLALLAVGAATLLLEPVARLAQAALRRRPGDMAEVLRGTARLWADLPRWIPGLLRGRA